MFRAAGVQVRTDSLTFDMRQISVSVPVFRGRK